MMTRNKILTLPVLRKKVLKARRQGKTIVFTNGCFDLMHAGHVAYLERIKGSQCVVVVGLNSDTSVRRLKGRGRPIQSQDARARVLAALACVDFVTIFSDPTPYQLISTLKPDILAKGADWKNKGVVGEDILKAYGGSVKLIRYVDHFSTTQIIHKIVRQCGV